jgi:hypothetical protein
MEQANDPVQRCAEAVGDALKQIGDISYAILPADIAHALGDLKKAFLGNIRSAIDWDIDWINERVAGGDKLRQEWKEKCENRASTEPPPEPIL